MKMTKAERDKILTLVEAATAKYRNMAEAVKDSTNPQCVEVHVRAVGMADAFESVAQAFKGDRINLNIWARE